MTERDGYKNYEDDDECGFVGPKPADAPSRPLHDIIDIVNEYWHATMDPRQTLAEVDSRPYFDRILMTLKVSTLAERITLLDRGQRWVARRLDELLEQPLTREAIGILEEMRRVQARNVERYEALIVELVPEHSPSVRKAAS
jgi:hypothetical protein